MDFVLAGDFIAFALFINCFRGNWGYVKIYVT